MGTRYYTAHDADGWRPMDSVGLETIEFVSDDEMRADGSLHDWLADECQRRNAAIARREAMSDAGRAEKLSEIGLRGYAACAPPGIMAPWLPARVGDALGYPRDAT